MVQLLQTLAFMGAYMALALAIAAFINSQRA